jgi:hypothetical protein
MDKETCEHFVHVHAAERMPGRRLHRVGPWTPTQAAGAPARHTHKREVWVEAHILLRVVATLKICATEMRLK